jgi:hypothetical protein
MFSSWKWKGKIGTAKLYVPATPVNLGGRVVASQRKSEHGLAKVKVGKAGALKVVGCHYFAILTPTTWTSGGLMTSNECVP